jgi:Ca2+-binding EF-hand superfamily protein
MEALRDVQNTGRLLFMMADANHDRLISIKEATDASNRLVGGFFFQADADGNGIVSQEEARAVRDTYLNQNPWVKYVVESLEAQAKQKDQGGNRSNPSPLLGFATVLDANNDKQIQATELRQLVQTMTQTVFAAADTNRDNQMSPTEVNAAIAGGVRSVAQASFQQADTDGNGQLSRGEYDKAIIEPANVVFQILDLNHDGQISQQESVQIERAIVAQLKTLQLPEAPNSATNLIEQGKLPRETSPVPTFAAPNTNTNTNPGQNRQPVAPAQPR